MQIKMTTDYGIRTVLYLAKKGGLVSSAEISREMHIPRNYLINIMKLMREADLVKAYQGQKGGYSLCREAKRISLYDIITALEGPLAINRCLESDGFCNRNAVKTCMVHDAYRGLQENMISYLQRITIEQLIDT